MAKRYEYFLSSRWRNRDQVLDLVKKLRAKNKTVYCFFESAESAHRMHNDPEQEMAAFEAIENWWEDPTVRKIFEIDMEAEKNSDHFIMLLPAGRSAHIEAGIAHGLGKKCILIGEQKEAESLYLIFDEHYPTIDAFIEALP